MTGKEDSTQAIDEELKQRMVARVASGAFGVEDLEDYLRLFVQVANNTEEIQDEVEGYDRNFQFRFTGLDNRCLKIREGKFEMVPGDIDIPDFVLEMDAGLACAVFTGQVDGMSAFMSGDLKFDGNLSDALKFRAIDDLIRETLELEPSRATSVSGAQAVSGLQEASIGEAGEGVRAVRFGAVGLGSVWRLHQAACAGSPFVRFVAVYDRNRKVAEKVARQNKAAGMQAYSDFQELLHSDIDAVLIMAPHIYHASLVTQAAAAGKHILCEKPMATTLEDCDVMIKAVKDAGVKFMIAENHRFLPAHLYISDAVKQGLIGDVLLVKAYEGVNELEGLSQPNFWKGDPVKAGGGSFMDMAAHKFTTLEWILDDQVESINVMLSKQAINLPEKAEDNALAMVRFGKGTIGSIIVSFTQISPAYNSLELYGTMGTILENHMWEKPVRIFSNHDAMGQNKNQWYEPEIEHAPFPLYYNISMRHEDEHFARCILEDSAPEFMPEQARSAIAAVLMGYLSVETGKTADRKQLAKVAKTGTRAILEHLVENIPVSKQLKEVKRVIPVGFNRKRMQEELEKRGLDLMIVTTPVNVFYVSGLPTLHASPNPILFALENMYPNVVMITSEGDSALLNWDVFQSIDRFSWIADHKGTIGQKETARALMSKIKQWGLEGKRIGVESLAPKYILDVLAKKNPSAEIVTADDVLLDLRLIKTDEEVRRIEEATRITEKAIEACMKTAKPGMTDNDFLFLARKTMLEEGSLDCDHLTLSIGESDPEAPGIGTVLKKGDIARFDFGAVCQGYVSDVNRHIVLGPVPGEAEQIIERLIQLQEYYEKRVKPGVNIKQLNTEANAFHKAATSAGMTFAVGHSIGLQCEERHLFGPMQVMDRPFEQNMVFEIEAWESFGRILIGVEDCYVVTAAGCRKITSLDKHILSL